jgi:hypothetical protein
MQTQMASFSFYCLVLRKYKPDEKTITVEVAGVKPGERFNFLPDSGIK